jgi:DNA polymerase-3 subunit alpha
MIKSKRKEIKMGFVHLHIHNSLGSRLDGIGSPEDYARRAFELNQKALAVTDHGRLSALYEHQIACIKYGVKPILGIEAYLQDSLEEYDEKKKRKRLSNNHIVLLVKNEIGYKNLLKLNWLSNKDEKHFYYVPRITTKELFEHKEGLVIGTACMASPFGRLLIDGKKQEAENLFETYVQRFEDDWYVEIQINEITREVGECPFGQKSINNWLIQQAEKYGIPIVLTGDVHYLEKGQDKLQTISIAIRNKTTLEDLKWDLESRHLYFHDEEDFIEFNEKWKYDYKKSDIIKWCNNSVYIADKCNYQIPERTKMFLPKVYENDDSFLINEAKKGLMKKFNIDNYSDIPYEYRKRLSKELEILIRKGFSSYINILQDVYNFVKEKKYYRGPGRGCWKSKSKVKMSNGQMKYIKNIVPGDFVISGNGKIKEVLNRFEYDIDEEIIKIELENGKFFECTKDHKILCNRSGEKIWIEAQNIKEGEEIVSISDREYKYCSECKEEKEIKNFYKENKVDGHSFFCKTCQKEYNKKNES